MKITLAKTLFCAALAPLALATQAMGATITWDTTAYQATSASDISTLGTQVSAISLHSSSTFNTPSGPVTVNGVTFDAASISGGSSQTISTAFSNPGSVVTTMSYVGGGNHGTNPPMTDPYMQLFITGLYIPDSSSGGSPITFSGLTPGHSYQLQIWAPFWGSGNNLRVSDTAPTLSGGFYNSANQSPTLLSGTASGSAPGYLVSPQYGLGTFTTGGAETTQSLYWYGDVANYGVIGAFQLRDLGAVPEPQTWALAALGISAVLFRLRRKQRVA